MVRGELHGAKEGRHRRSGKVTTAIGQHHTGKGGGHIGQREQFPDVARTDDDEKITREPVPDGAKHREIPFHVHGDEQDEEAQHHDENPTYGLRKAQRIDLSHPTQQRRGVVGGTNLERGHAAKQGIGPPGGLATVRIAVERTLMTIGKALQGVALAKHVAVHVAGIEVNPRDGGHQHDSHYPLHQRAHSEHAK